MKWTSEKPTEPGHYWYLESSDRARVHEVYRLTETSLLRTAEYGPVRFMHGQWSGPIAEPEE